MSDNEAFSSLSRRFYENHVNVSNEELRKFLHTTHDESGWMRVADIALDRLEKSEKLLHDEEKHTMLWRRRAFASGFREQNE